MKLSVLFTTSVCALFLSGLSFQAIAATSIFDEASRSFYQNRFIFETNYRYFQTEANYTQEGGQYVSLPAKHSYKVSDLDFGVRWTTGKTYGLYLSSRFSQAESNNGLNARSNGQLNQVVTGVDMLLVSNSKFDLIPDLYFVYPLQRVDKKADEVLTGEGAIEFTGRLIGRLKWGALQPFASAGVTYRDEGRSTLIPFAAGAELSLSKLKIGADVSGYQTILKDQYTNNSAERHVVSLRNGGSLKYYSVDPSLLESSAWLRWQSTNFSLKAGAATTVTGAATAAGMTFFAGLGFSFDTDSRRRRSEVPAFTPEPVQDDDVQKFEETVNDGVDQNLFRKPTPPPKPKPRPDPAQQRKKMKQELDQTEFQIELKKTSPRKQKK